MPRPAAFHPSQSVEAGDATSAIWKSQCAQPRSAQSGQDIKLACMQSEAPEGHHPARTGAERSGPRDEALPRRNGLPALRTGHPPTPFARWLDRVAAAQAVRPVVGLVERIGHTPGCPYRTGHPGNGRSRAADGARASRGARSWPSERAWAGDAPCRAAPSRRRRR
jgi:hypothetical protein